MSSASPAPATLEVLQFTGYSSGRGGVNAALRALTAEAPFQSVLGVHPEFRPADARGLATLALPAIEAERITPRNFWHARAVARQVQDWLRASPVRVFHGHTRAGLLVALWLSLMGERRALATVRSLGRRRWFYRLAHARLGSQMRWLGPAMKRHYRVAPFDWSDCLPDAVSESTFRPVATLPRSQSLTFGAIGALVPVKQWEILLRALAAVPRGVSARVVHAGSQDGTIASAAYENELRHLHRALGLGDRWEWRGEVNDTGVLLESLDCVVVASEREASSMAALEAIAAGVPVLAPSASGTSDLLQRTGGGWTFRDPTDLTQQMTGLAAGSRLKDWRRDDAGLAWFGARRVAAEHLGAYQSLFS